jgi:hypothetical protein
MNIVGTVADSTTFTAFACPLLPQVLPEGSSIFRQTVLTVVVTVPSAELAFLSPLVPLYRSASVVALLVEDVL